MIHTNRKTTSLCTLGVLILILHGCKPPHHPKNPDYSIKKPTVKYAPSTKSLDKMVKKLQGKPYVWAEEGPNTFDCSGFTYYMYGSMGIEIPRVAREQAKKGKRIKRNELIYGDLIFFDTEARRRGKITHVGMYLGNGWFTHASTTKYEVVYSNLDTSPYYKKRLRICRRYLPEMQNKIAVNSTEKPWEKKKTIPLKPAPIQVPQVIKKPIEGNFYVQVGSFTGKPKEALLYKITREGYRHKIITFPMNGKQISKLLIGPYKQKSDASVLLEKIQNNIQKDAFIAEIR